MRRVPRLALAVGVVLAATAAACGSTEPAPEAGEGPPPDDALLAFVIATDAAVGDNRIAVVLLDHDGQPIEDRADDIQIDYGPQESGEKRHAAEPVYRAWPGSRGAYTTTATFDQAGIWEFIVELTDAGAATRSGSALIQVKEQASTPAIGVPAPPTPSKTGSTSSELARITSDPDPNPDFYRISVDDAVAAGRPVVVTFATPAWCTSKTCGPQLEVLGSLQERFNDRADFIHVEIFDNPHEMAGDPANGVESPILEPWGLTSEPWTFVLDRDGRVAAKFEAFTTGPEIEEALQAVLGS